MTTFTIHCAVCSRPVDRVTASYDHSAMGTRITAFCHGSKESMMLEDEALVEMRLQGAAQLGQGVASRTMAVESK